MMKTLKDIEPTLQIMRQDSVIHKMAMEDFWAYLAFLDKQFEKFPEEDVEDMVDTVNAFARMWWKKYLERVQLKFKDDPKPFSVTRGTELLKRIFNLSEEDEIIEAMTNVFIKNGEICCPKKLARGTIIGVLSRFSKKEQEQKWTLRRRLELMSVLLRETNRVSRITGPLIFMRVGKGYYLGEYRFGGDMPSIKKRGEY